jgi:nucleoid-associated protein YgaU
VNTGERIVISPHHKLSFIPEKEVKDLINKPFASFEAIEANQDGEIGEVEEVGKVGEIDKTGEIGEAREVRFRSLTSDEVGENVREVLGEEKEEQFEQTSTPWSDRETIEHLQEENLAPPLPPPPPPLQSIHPTPPESQPEPPPLPPPPKPEPLPTPPSQPAKKESKKKKKSKGSSTKLLLYILFFLIFILIGGGVWYFFFSPLNKSLDDFNTERLGTRISDKSSISLPDTTLRSDTLSAEVKPAIESMANTQPDSTKTEVSEPLVPTPVSEPSTTPVKTETSIQPPNTSSTNNVLARVRMERGQRLTLIAESYYGLKVFWVYIYEYNKDKIGSNPDRIPVGMEIVVPAKSVYDIDANSPASVERATALQTRIMTRYY